MKKILALAFISMLSVGCSKENDKPWQDSNTMLPEPEAAITDSAAAAEAPDQGAVSINSDSLKTGTTGHAAPAIVDSAKAE